jgi:hypothetical protein
MDMSTYVSLTSVDHSALTLTKPDAKDKAKDKKPPKTFHGVFSSLFMMMLSMGAMNFISDDITNGLAKFSKDINKISTDIASLQKEIAALKASTKKADDPDWKKQAQGFIDKMKQLKADAATLNTHIAAYKAWCLANNKGKWKGKINNTQQSLIDDMQGFHDKLTNSKGTGMIDMIYNEPMTYGPHGKDKTTCGDLINGKVSDAAAKIGGNFAGQTGDGKMLDQWLSGGDATTPDAQCIETTANSAGTKVNDDSTQANQDGNNLNMIDNIMKTMEGFIETELKKYIDGQKTS